MARLRTDLLDKRLLAMLLETSKALIYMILVSGQPLRAIGAAMSPDVDDVVYTAGEDAWKGGAGGLRRRDRVVSRVTANSLEKHSRWFEETR